jgi:hypothetical protein
MLKWQLAAVTRIGAVALMVNIAWLGWHHLGPRRPEIGYVRQQMADRIILDIAEDIRLSRGDIRYTALLHFQNDPANYFTDKLRSVIEQRGILNLRDRTFSEKFKNLLKMRLPSYHDTETVLKMGRKMGADGVLYGTIHAFESYPGGVKLDVEVSLADVSANYVFFNKYYSKESASSMFAAAAAQDRVTGIPWFQRFLGWLFIVLLLPVFTINFIRTMVRKDSNKTNAFVLSIYTLADTILAFLLVGAALTSWFPVLVFIAAVACAFLYNVKIMTFALRLEEV